VALAKAYSVGLVGLQGHVVEVEADLADGLPGLTVIGLPDAALAEARDRVRAAVVNSGQRWPQRRITLALSPAAVPKRGSGFDLALAAAVLAASGCLPAEALLDRVLLGELGLDGRVRPVPGVLPAVLTAARAGVERVVVPLENLAEATLLPGSQARGVGSLRDATLEDLERAWDGMDDVVRRRARHVISENARVLDFADALRRGDSAPLGALLAASHESLRADFEVSTSELDLLVATALKTDGVLGSRMTGAGFGGCTVSLVDLEVAEQVRDEVCRRYAEASGLTPRGWVSKAADGASVL